MTKRLVGRVFTLIITSLIPISVPSGVVAKVAQVAYTR